MAIPNRDLSHHLVKFEGMAFDEPLYKAIQAGDMEKTADLLNAGSRVGSFNEQGKPVVVGAESEEMFRLLLRFGLDINTHILNGNWTLAHLARTPDRVFLLARLNADLEAVNDLGQTPVFASLHPPDVRLLRAFVCCGVDINFQELGSQQSLLHAAINLYNVHFAQELVRLGIDVNLVDREGDSSLGILASFVDRQNMENLEHVELARLIIARTEDVSFTARVDCMTPLHIACARNAGKLVTLMLEAGANPEAVTATGNRPIDIARLNDSVDARRSLEAFGVAD